MTNIRTKAKTAATGATSRKKNRTHHIRLRSAHSLTFKTIVVPKPVPQGMTLCKRGGAAGAAALD